MNHVIRRFCLFCLLLGAGLTAWAQSGEVVRQVVIQSVGPPAASDALIRANIHVKEGDIYNPASVDEDVRNLYRTGYFYNIKVEDQPVNGGIKLIYLLEGNPTITQIRFVGNKVYSTRKLRKTISSKVGEPLNERKLFEDTQAILKLYQKSGRQKTQVKYVPEIDHRLGRSSITFEITEAPKVKIKNVRFLDAHAFSQRKLRFAIKTRRHWMFSWLTGSGVLKQDVFDEDKDRLTEFYQERGYIDFAIKNIQINQVSPKWIVINITVSEGNRYRVGSVKLQGNKLFPTDQILSRMFVRKDGKFRYGLNMGPGDIFTPKGLATDQQAILNFYGSRGYIDTQVTPERIPNTEQGTMDLNFQIDEGAKSYIERIDIQGNTKTKDKVIRRELAVNPGEVFNLVRVALSTNRLYGLNYFSRVDYQAVPTDVQNHKDLVISVEEKNTGNVRVGAGFSSIDSLVGFVEVTQGNFDLFKPPYFFGTGGGQKIRLRAQYGIKHQDYDLTFIEPWFLGRKLALSTDFYYRELDYYSSLYNVRDAGVRVGLTRTLWNDFWVGGVNYTIENIGIVDMPNPTQVINPDGTISVVDPVPHEIRQEEGYTLESKIGASIAYDTRNSVFLPNHGQRTRLMTQFAGGPFGGDTDFYKVQADSDWFFPGLFKGHVLEVDGRAGVVDNHSGDTRVHLFDRWFLGGLDSLEGYKYRAVGPYDSTGSEPIGGKTFWFGTAEYSIPIIERLRFALFYDIGNVYPNAYSFATAGPDYGLYSDDWGVGIRLNIPYIGPLRLDYAIPLTHDRFTSSSGQFQFGVGYTREY